MTESRKFEPSMMNSEEEVILWVTSDLCDTSGTGTASLNEIENSEVVQFVQNENEIMAVDQKVVATTLDDMKFETPTTPTEGEEATVEVETSKKFRRRGMVWNFFTIVEEDRAKCCYCSAAISFKGKSTNNLLRHLRTRHGEDDQIIAHEGGSEYLVLKPPNKSKGPVFEEDEDGKSSVSNTYKRRGGVWTYYRTNHKKQAQCRLCNNVISYKGGSTTNLLRHMKSMHPDLEMIKDNTYVRQPKPNQEKQRSLADIVNECVEDNEFGNVVICSDELDAPSVNVPLVEMYQPFEVGSEEQLVNYRNAPEQAPAPVHKERKKPAVLWRYFTKDNDVRATCLTCNAKISFKGGSTGNLLRHLKTKHVEIDLTPPESKSEVANSSDSDLDLTLKNDDDDDDVEEEEEDVENKELAKFVKLLNPNFNLEHVDVPNLTERERPKRIYKRGAAMAYFQINSPELATCLVCDQEIVLKNKCKAPLLRHLKAKHPQLDKILTDQTDHIVMNGMPNPQENTIETLEANDGSTELAEGYFSQENEKLSKKLRKRGLVWNHFVPLEEEKAKCSFCPAVISYKSGSTSNLLRHMKNKHPEIDVLDVENPVVDLDDSFDDVRVMDVEKSGKSSDSDENHVEEKQEKPKKRVKRKHGRVWNFFLQKGDNKARCIKCSTTVTYCHGTTTNLLRHIAKKHPDIDLDSHAPVGKRYRRRTRSLARAEESDPDYEPSEPEEDEKDDEKEDGEKTNAIFRRSEVILRKHFHKFINRPVSVTKSRVFDEQLTKMIVKQYCPFTIVENEDFKSFVASVNPGYSMPSRKTISSRLIPELYAKCSDRVNAALRPVRHVTVATNGWSLSNSEKFIAITVHFIDPECRYQAFLLDCFKYDENVAAENLAGTIKKILADWGVQQKVIAVVSDNAANLTAAIRLRSWRHIPCFSNLMNMIVQGGLLEIRHVVDKARQINDFFKRYPMAMKRLATLQKELGLKETKIIPDNPNHWVSTHDMFMRLMETKDALVALGVAYNDTLLPMLNEYEWTVVEKLCQILRPFADIANELSQCTVSVSKVIPLSHGINNYLHRVIQEDQLPSELINMTSRMLDDIAMRFEDVEDNALLAEATLLDPRFKKLAFTNDTSFQNTYHAVLQKSSAQKVPDEVPKVTTKTTDMWSDFDTKASLMTGKISSEVAAASELEHYMSERLIARSADPLLWWKRHSTLYPRLFELMKQRLSIAATASPKYFDAGQIICEKRNKLSANKVAMVLFLKHNL